MWGPMVGGLSCSTSYAVMRWGKGDALVLDPCRHRHVPPEGRSGD